MTEPTMRAVLYDRSGPAAEVLRVEHATLAHPRSGRGPRLLRVAAEQYAITELNI